MMKLHLKKLLNKLQSLKRLKPSFTSKIKSFLFIFTIICTVPILLISFYILIPHIENFNLSINKDKVLKINSNDNPIKVITKYQDTKIYSLSDRKVSIDSVDCFQFYYLFSGDDDVFHLIGRGIEKADAWIKKEDVIKWENREAICIEQIENVSSDQLISFFYSFNDLLNGSNPDHIEDIFIIPNFTYTFANISNEITKKQLSSLQKGVFKSHLKKKLTKIFAKNYNKYLKNILDTSKKFSIAYTCNASYSHKMIPMPVLKKIKHNVKNYYKVAFLSFDNDTQTYVFDEGWINIPQTRKYRIKVYLTREELEIKQQLLATIAQALLENPDTELFKSDKKDKKYINKLLGILTGNNSHEDRSSSLFSILLDLPKASKPREIIRLDNNNTYMRVKHTLKQLYLIENQCYVSGDKGGWVDFDNLLYRQMPEELNYKILE